MPDATLHGNTICINTVKAPCLEESAALGSDSSFQPKLGFRQFLAGEQHLTHGSSARPGETLLQRTWRVQLSTQEVLPDQESVSALTAALCFTQNIPATCAWGSHGITLQSWACHRARVRNKGWHCPGKFIVQHLEPLLMNNNNKLCTGPCQVLFQSEIAQQQL